MHIRCGCNLHLNQALLYTTSTKFKHCHLCVCHRKEHGGGTKKAMSSDVLSLWKDDAYKVMFKFKKFHTAYS